MSETTYGSARIYLTECYSSSLIKCLSLSIHKQNGYRTVFPVSVHGTNQTENTERSSYPKKQNNSSSVLVLCFSNKSAGQQKLYYRALYVCVCGYVCVWVCGRVCVRACVCVCVCSMQIVTVATTRTSVRVKRPGD